MSFSLAGKVQFLQGLFLELWGHLEIVIEHLVAPIEIILNDLVTPVHIGGSKPTHMSSKF
jgi:hypothetical protein